MGQTLSLNTEYPLAVPQRQTYNIRENSNLEPDKPSAGIVLAVLPFENLSDNNELAYFAQGFVEDIITDLSRFKPLQIISSYSSRSIKDSASEDQFVQSNNISYLLKGSFRHDKGHVRISTQLINAADKSIHWADRYDERLEEIFQIQSDIAQRIVSTLSTQIDLSILSAARRKPVTNLDAYDCWLRGMELLRRGSADHDHQARKLFNQALEKDKHFTRAYTGLSLTYFNEWSCQLWDKWDENERGAYTYAEKAAQLDETDHLAQMVLARTLIYRKQYDSAREHIRNSLDLNSNDADSLVQLATSLGYIGEFDEAVELYHKAVRLNPNRQHAYNTYGLYVYFLKGEYKKSIELAERSSFKSGWIDFPAYLAFCYIHDGQPENARQQWERFEKAFEEKISGRGSDTQEVIDWLLKDNPFRDPRVFLDALDKMKSYGIFTNIDEEKPRPVSSVSLRTKNTFRKEAEVWALSFEGTTVYLPALKGFNDITLLLSRPTVEVHCSALMDLPVNLVKEEYAVDEKAKREYRQHLRRLQEEIDEAEEMNDSERLGTLRESMDQILQHLSSVTDIYGRPRKLNSVAEKTRSAVTWRIRNAIKKIAQVHPALGLHLNNSIKTGTFCSYSPEKAVDWEL